MLARATWRWATWRLSFPIRAPALARLRRLARASLVAAPLARTTATREQPAVTLEKGRASALPFFFAAPGSRNRRSGVTLILLPRVHPIPAMFCVNEEVFLDRLK